MAKLLVDLYSGNSANFTELAQKYDGVIFKAGQGTLPDVPRVHPEWAEQARAAGLLVGWYWLMDCRYKPSLQVQATLETLADFGELGLWVDCEKPRLGMTDVEYWEQPYSGYRHIYDYMSGIQLTKRSKFNLWLPGLYTSPGFWSLLNVPVASADWFAQAPLWEAHYTSASSPMPIGRWPAWTLWQYRESPDENRFNGTDQEFDAFFQLGGQTPPPEPGDEGMDIGIMQLDAYLRAGPQPTPKTDIYVPRDSLVQYTEKAGEWVRITAVRRFGESWQQVEGWLPLSWNGNPWIKVATVTTSELLPEKYTCQPENAVNVWYAYPSKSIPPSYLWAQDIVGQLNADYAERGEIWLYSEEVDGWLYVRNADGSNKVVTLLPYEEQPPEPPPADEIIFEPGMLTMQAEGLGIFENTQSVTFRKTT